MTTICTWRYDNAGSNTVLDPMDYRGGDCRDSCWITPGYVNLGGANGWRRYWSGVSDKSVWIVGT